MLLLNEYCGIPQKVGGGKSSAGLPAQHDHKANPRRWAGLAVLLMGSFLPALGKHPVRLSITHKLSTDCGSEFDVYQARQASPHDHVSGWRIVGPGQIAAESRDFGQICGELFRCAVW